MIISANRQKSTALGKRFAQRLHQSYNGAESFTGKFRNVISPLYLLR